MIVELSVANLMESSDITDVVSHMLWMSKACMSGSMWDMLGALKEDNAICNLVSTTLNFFLGLGSCIFQCDGRHL